jgi:hypothetical protein
MPGWKGSSSEGTGRSKELRVRNGILLCRFKGPGVPDLTRLRGVFEETRAFLERPDNDYAWSSWQDSSAALSEVDRVLSQLKAGRLPGLLQMRVLFAPTGPIQEVSISSGWGEEFLSLADRFDSAIEGRGDRCRCLDSPGSSLQDDRNLGMDRNFAEVSLCVCGSCGRHWIRYYYEVEAFSKSGRWYLGPISSEQAAFVTADQARSTLEQLDWYFYGGSYYGGETGRSSGPITLSP